MILNKANMCVYIYRKKYLVDSWRNFGCGEQDFNLFAREIADSNGFSEAKSLTLLHSFPNRLKVQRKNILFTKRKTFTRRHRYWPVN